jgi:hypothetical protein
MNDPIRNSDTWHGTTILTVRKGGKVVIAGDGQVSLGATVIKANAKKVRSVGLPAPRPMPSRCSSGWRTSSSSIRVSSRAPAWNSPRTGARTAICDGWKP